jgi:hypothetical protein
LAALVLARALGFDLACVHGHNCFDDSQAQAAARMGGRIPAAVKPIEDLR